MGEKIATMEFTNDWQFPPDLFHPQYQQGQPGYRLSNNTAYFQSSSRIGKPLRKHVSPRGSLKRKANSIPPVPTRTRSVIDRRPTFPQIQNEYNRTQARPLSWHPLSQYTDYGAPTMTLPTDYLRPFTTAEVNGVITPLSLPFADEPQIQDIATPLDELSGNDFVSYYPMWNKYDVSQNPYWPSEENVKLTSNPGFGPAQEGYATDYYNMYNQFHATSIKTAPASPNFLPIQSHHDDPDLADSLHLVPTTSNSDELVGMGLYDSPAEVQSSLLGLGAPSVFGPRRSISKGLKLEDSFVPPEPGPEEEEGEEEEGAESADTEDEEEDSADQQLPLQGQNTTTYPGLPLAQHNLANQSFYFDQDYALENTSTYADPSYPMSGWGATQYNPYGWV